MERVAAEMEQAAGWKGGQQKQKNCWLQNTKKVDQAANCVVVFQDQPAPLTANANERKRHKQRCHRCGGVRSGAQHGCKAKQNTLEHCRVTEEHRHPTWQVPEGCNIGDPEGTSLTSMQMIARWRSHRHRESMDVDPEWSKWWSAQSRLGRSLDPLLIVLASAVQLTSLACPVQQFQLTLALQL